MNFQFYFEKLMDSETFRKFKDQHKDAFLCSCFFSIDEKGNDNKTHFDYYIPSEKKLFSFKLENNCEMIPVEIIEKGYNPKKISDNHNFSLDEIQELISKKIQSENLKNKLEKTLLSLQEIDGTEFLTGTLFLSGLAMIKISINLETKEIEDFEKKSFFDILNVKRKK